MTSVLSSISADQLVVCLTEQLQTLSMFWTHIFFLQSSSPLLVLLQSQLVSYVLYQPVDLEVSVPDRLSALWAVLVTSIHTLLDTSHTEGVLAAERHWVSEDLSADGAEEVVCQS